MTTKQNLAEAVVIERTFDAPVVRVWKAITDVEAMRRWYFDLKEFKPEFELFPEDGKTRLKLTHEGLETFPKTPSFARKNFMEGWTQIVGSSLKGFVEGDGADQS